MCPCTSRTRFVEDPPYLSEEREKAKRGGIDYIGLGLVALGIGCLQMVMDKGQELDWFGSHLITVGLIVGRFDFDHLDRDGNGAIRIPLLN